MNELTIQELLSLLSASKAHIEAGEHAEAIEKIDAAIANLENAGVATADEEGGQEGGEGGNDGLEEGDGKEEKPKPRPLPGQGTNGPLNP